MRNHGIYKIENLGIGNDYTYIDLGKLVNVDICTRTDHEYYLYLTFQLLEQPLCKSFYNYMEKEEAYNRCKSEMDKLLEAWRQFNVGST